MLRVGLTGGLASGKSFVGKVLAGLGCLVVEADQLGHEVLEPGAEAYAQTIEEFGNSILRPDHTIDRLKLAEMVFVAPERLEKLNAIVHPPVRARSAALEHDFFKLHPRGIAVHEAAILIETGSYRKFDRMIVAACTREQQIARAMERDGATLESVIARLARQMPLAEKVRFADYVIDTSNTKEHTSEQTAAVFAELEKLAAQGDPGSTRSTIR